MYEYKAYVLRVVDGDTFEVDIDLGFRTKMVKTIRLYGINAFENRLGRGTTIKEKAKGVEAKILIRSMIEDKEVILKTKKDRSGKYGRLLAEVVTLDGQDIGQLLLDRKLAVPYMDTHRRYETRVPNDNQQNER